MDAFEYVQLLSNPFSPTPVKFLDGKVTNSSSVQTKSAGVYQVPSGTDQLNFLLIPCLNNFINIPGQTNGSLFIPPDHMNGVSTVKGAHYSRLTSCAVRLRLLNKDTFQEDGKWEAIRIPSYGIPNLDYNVNAGMWAYAGAAPGPFSNHPSYQTGNLRDIDKFVFKLNSENNSFLFDREALKPGFDVVYIRIFGRITDETRISWNAVCNQEIVYRAGTALAKFHTPNIAMPNFEYLVSRANWFYPGEIVPE